VTSLRQALLAPASIALVGASNDRQKAASRPLEFLRDSGYPGAVYPVNSRHPSVGGQAAYPDLRALPEVPEHVLLMTPADSAIEVVRDCADLGVPVVTVLSDGFAETGPAGAYRQRRLLDTAAGGGVRVLGPNSLGLVNLANGLRLTGNAVFGERDLRAGGTFVASQSGSMIGALVSRGQAKGLGFASVISVGGEADLSVGEICGLAVDDDGVTGFLLFLETIRHADELARFAQRAAEAGKPVIAYKLGRSRLAAQLAVSHTGALVGDDDVADAFFSACGIARVHTLDGLLEAQGLLAQVPPRPAGGRPLSVGVVSTTGGGAAMVADQLGIRGIDVTEPLSATYEKLAERGVAVSRGPIVDLTLAGTRYDVMRQTLETLLGAPELDLVVAVVGSSARLRPDLAVAPIADAAGPGRALAAFLVPDAPGAAASLASAGVPAFTSPEVCADVIAAAAARREWRTVHAAPAGPGTAESGTRVLDEAEAYGLMARLGVPIGPHAVLEADALSGPLPFAFPVAVKVLDDQITHKSDVGGVVLGVGDSESLHDAVAAITGNVARHRPDRPVRRVLVQQMTSGIGELLVGYRQDALVGPVVVVAAGGTLTELYGDRSVRLAPVDLQAAREMLTEVVSVRQLRGFRGAPEGDLDAVADAVVALSRAACDPAVVEAEVNPLIVRQRGQGAVAVDAVVIVRATAGLGG
jgi:acetate---CoA ligase (ADP-forming)